MASQSPQRSPKLPGHLKRQLREITPSLDGDLKYYPCAVQLKDGNEVDRVYLVDELPYIRHWGMYPHQDPRKAEILVKDVAVIRESPSRLPVRFANELYKAGESGMGYTVFTVVFTTGLQQAYLTGNAVDFIDYPEGVEANDVVAVLPHVGRDSHREGPGYYWCLYSE